MWVVSPLVELFSIGRGGGADRGWGICMGFLVSRKELEFWHQREIGGRVVSVMSWDLGIGCG